MTSADSDPPESPDNTFRKLVRSMILVIILIACAAVLLGLGQCAR